MLHISNNKIGLNTGHDQMKLISSKILIFVLLFSSFTVLGQEDGPEKLVGVSKGQTYDYVITEKFGLEGPSFSDGFNNMTLEAGDTFKMTVLTDTPTISNTIDVEIWNSEVNVTYAIALGFFDLVIYRDWEFWQNVLGNAGFGSYIDDDLFSFAYTLEDNVNGLLVYLEYSYDVNTGVNTHQLVYVAPQNDIQNPISFIQIDLGKTAMPRVDLSNIGFNSGEFFSYEVLQIDGFGGNSVIDGIDGGLQLNTGDNFLVSPLSDTPGTTDSVLATIQSDDGGIVYQNRLDFLNSVNSPAFFIYNDWEYIEDLVDRMKTEAEEGLTISYDFTSDEFIYEENYISGIGGYTLELIYDLTTGVLTYESFFVENSILSTVQIIEFTLRDTIEIDESLQNFELRGDYEYELVKYKPVSNADPLFETEDDQFFIFEGDKFTISPQTGPDSDHLVPLSISSVDGNLVIFNNLDGLGSFFVYADWTYWETVIELLQDFSIEGLTITYEQDDDTFTIHRLFDTTDLQSDEEMVYDKATGVLKSYSYAAIGLDPDGKEVSLIIIFELKDSPDKSDKDDTPAFALPLGIFALVTLVVFRRKLKK